MLKRENICNNENPNENLYNDEIIRKIFDMMGNFTHRIVQVENKTNTNITKWNWQNKWKS